MPPRQGSLESRGAVSEKQLDMCFDIPNGEFSGNKSAKVC